MATGGKSLIPATAKRACIFAWRNRICHDPNPGLGFVVKFDSSHLSSLIENPPRDFRIRHKPFADLRICVIERLRAIWPVRQPWHRLSNLKKPTPNTPFLRISFGHDPENNSYSSKWEAQTVRFYRSDAPNRILERLRGIVAPSQVVGQTSQKSVRVKWWGSN